MRSSRKKATKKREKLQGFTVTVALQTEDRERHESNEDEDKDKDRDKEGGEASATSETEASLTDLACKIMDHLFLEKSVSEVQTLEARQEMFGLTSLSMAATIGHLDSVKKLLEAGTRVDDRSSDGSTPLLNAVHWRHLQVVDLLLQHGASVAAIDNDGNNSLMIAMRHGDMSVVNALWTRASDIDINHANKAGCTALHVAAECMWERCVRFLVLNGGQVNQQNNLGQTALHLAAAKGDHSTAERLLEAGASIVVEDKENNTCVCVAFQHHHERLAQFFLTRLTTVNRLPFCKRRVDRVLGQVAADSSKAELERLAGLDVLIFNFSLRDTLLQCDLITAMVHLLQHCWESETVVSYLCSRWCELMFNNFGTVDERFVVQFLTARGPDIMLDLLDKDASKREGSKGQGQEQMQESSLHMNFAIMPVLVVAETKAGTEWAKQPYNHRRLKRYAQNIVEGKGSPMQLMATATLGLQNKDKVRYSAMMAHLLAFHSSLINQDSDDKMQQLLELEQREKSRKERKREKKRQQRLKHKMKARAGETDTEVGGQEEAERGDSGTSSRETTLDASNRETTLDTPNREITLETASRATTLDTVSRVTTQDTPSRMTTQDTVSRVTTQDTSSRVTTQDTSSRVTNQDTSSRVTTQDTSSKVTSQDTSSRVTTQDTSSKVTTQDTSSRVTSLDALDDIPLMVGPDGKQDIPIGVTIISPPQYDLQAEEEWTTVAGKRSYPVKVRATTVETGGEARHSREPQLAPSLLTPHAAVPLEGTTSLSRDLHVHKARRQDHGDVCEGGVGDVRICGRGCVRWADVARLGVTSLVVDTARLSPTQYADTRDRTQGCARKDLNKEEFPTLSKQFHGEKNKCSGSTSRRSSEESTHSAEHVPPGVHKARGSLEHCTGIQPVHGKRATSSKSADLPFTPEGLSILLSSVSSQGSGCIDPRLLYEKLSQWMLKSVRSQGLAPPVHHTMPREVSSHSPRTCKMKTTAAEGDSVSTGPADRLVQDGPRDPDDRLDDEAKNVSGLPVAQSDSLDMRWKLGNSRCFSENKLYKFKHEDKSFATTCSFRPAWMEQEVSLSPVHKMLKAEGSSSADIWSRPASDRQQKYCPFENADQRRQPFKGSATKNLGVGLSPQKMELEPLGSGQDLCPKPAPSASHSSQFYFDADNGPCCDSPLPASNGHSSPSTCHMASSQTLAPHFDKSSSDMLCRADTLESSMRAVSEANCVRSHKTSTPAEMHVTRCSSITDFQSSEHLADLKTAELRSYLDVFFKENPKRTWGIEGVKDTWGKTDSEHLSGCCGSYGERFTSECIPEDHHQPQLRPSSKSVVVSVLRLSDSDSTQSSSKEKLSETHPCGRTSSTPIASTSTFSNLDSFPRATPSNSRSSSSGTIHECLAPGFLRAASGESQTRTFDSFQDRHVYASEDSSLFRNVYGNVGLLQLGQRHQENNDATKNNESLYPDLSTVPEKDVPNKLVSPQPAWSRVVGHGRPQPSKSSHEEKSDGVKDQSHDFLDWTTLIGTDYVPPDLPEDPLSHACLASGQLVYPSVTTPVFKPEVLFPGSLREDDQASPPKPTDVFPSIHDMNEHDLFQDVFSNSYFLEQIAIDQIRRRLRSLGGGELMEHSVLHHDLDYYASIYGVRLKDVLGPRDDPSIKKPMPSQQGARRREREEGVPEWKVVVRELGRRAETGTDGDVMFSEDPEEGEEGHDVSGWPWHSSKVPLPHIVSTAEGPEDVAWQQQQSGGSRRWRAWLRQILNMPWTMRRQYGKIVLPARSMEYNISRTGSFPLILGFLTDGTEVGVLALDRTRHALDTRLMATVAADSEPDVHFVLRYKAVWESAGRVYLAMELCDYTLDEYVSIVRLDHRQDPLSANRLAWQMLKGLKYLHANFAVPHGSLMPGWIFVDCDGRLRLAGYGLREVGHSREWADKGVSLAGDARFWRATDHVAGLSVEPTFKADIQVAGMLLYYILTGGRHPFGDTSCEVENNLRRSAPRPSRVSHEADHLVSSMLTSDPDSRPSVDVCLKHPFFWSGEKRFRLVLIVGSDILTEMKTGVPLTGPGSASMMDILNIVYINSVSDNWLSEVDPVLVKEMRAFRQYKNTLSELVLFVYNCCLHFDKMSTVGKEVLDDPCKYFQTRFPALFMAVYRAMRASDRTDRTCYKPFF